MINDIDLKLLVGKPIDVGIGKLYPLTIDDIVEMGVNQYYRNLNLLLLDVNDLEITEEQLKEMGISDFTTYHFLLLESLNNQEFRELVVNAFECFFQRTVFFDEDNLLFRVEDEPDCFPLINFEYFDLIRKVLIKQNYLKELEEEENLVFGNELAKKWYYDLKRKEKEQPKPKSSMDLSSMISAVMWKTSKSPDEILKMTIYQLYDGFHRLSLIDSCNNLAQGISHGTVDQKSVKDNDLNWAKIIKFDN